MGKKLGQHFLRSTWVLEKLLALAQGEGPLLEVGCGEGVLTLPLAKQGRDMVGVEVDPSLADHLRQSLSPYASFRLLEEDMRKTSLETQSLFQKEGRYTLVANLPYYLSTPFLLRLVQNREHLKQAILMVQYEFAQRMCAKKGDKSDYGSLSVLTQYAFRTEFAFSVPPEAFLPRPKVNSAVVCLFPHPKKGAPSEERAFLRHVQWAFSQRRKKLCPRILQAKPSLSLEKIEKVKQFLQNKRPEELTVEEHEQLFYWISPKTPTL